MSLSLHIQRRNGGVYYFRKRIPQVMRLRYQYALKYSDEFERYSALIHHLKHSLQKAMNWLKPWPEVSYMGGYRRAKKSWRNYRQPSALNYPLKVSSNPPLCRAYACRPSCRMSRSRKLPDSSLAGAKCSVRYGV